MRPPAAWAIQVIRAMQSSPMWARLLQANVLSRARTGPRRAGGGNVARRLTVSGLMDANSWST